MVSDVCNLYACIFAAGMTDNLSVWLSQGRVITAVAWNRESVKLGTTGPIIVGTKKGTDTANLVTKVPTALLIVSRSNNDFSSKTGCLSLQIAITLKNYLMYSWGGSCPLISQALRGCTNNKIDNNLSFFSMFTSWWLFTYTYMCIWTLLINLSIYGVIITIMVQEMEGGSNKVEWKLF